MLEQLTRYKWLLGGLIIAGTLAGMTFLTLDKFSVYFFTPDEALAQSQTLSQREIRVGGMVEGGSVVWDPQTLNLSFILSNLKDTRIKVHYKGAPPDMFKENSGVVVEGRIISTGTEFTAKKLIVKHSEEYRAPHEGQKVDMKLVEKSMFKVN